jgi:hypothetical protein
LSLEGRELKAESSILRRHGRMTAEEESFKTKQEQGEAFHTFTLTSVASRICRPFWLKANEFTWKLSEAADEQPAQPEKRTCFHVENTLKKPH